MTAAEFREAVVVAFREVSGVEPPGILVTGDEQTGFTVAFTTSVWTRDAAKAVTEFRSAALLFGTSSATFAAASKALGEQGTAEDLFRQQLQSAGIPPIVPTEGS